MAIESRQSELEKNDGKVLNVLLDGRANPLLIRDKTDLDKGETNTILVRLGRQGFVNQVTRGLYEITEKGKSAICSSQSNRRFHPPIKESDKETFPLKANETEQSGYMQWILLGVNDEAGFYFDRTKRTVHKVTTDEGELIEEDSWSIQDRVYGESASERVLTYVEVEQRDQIWDRWSEYSLAISFANAMKTLAPTLLSDRECLVYSMVQIFDIQGTDTLSFTDETSMSTASETRRVERKLEESQDLLEWIRGYSGALIGPSK
ncbi:hypothetical protein [Halopenitus persicus]|uniref:Uncharacterized protein n=1 Tax=Halopenitus persicus TaxID=1048396 RepID=A0A1H3IS29_9EURY|nr:hypothetical protein [Halopenitus persicus]SDY29674.1 hypothetical protein SAMN05216564_104211 [Halopenitus persicus]